MAFMKKGTKEWALRERLLAVLRGVGIEDGAAGFVGVVAVAWRAGSAVGMTLDVAHAETLIARLAAREGCAHQAISPEPSPVFDGAPCPRCGQYYVDDDSTRDDTSVALPAVTP